MQGDCQTEPYGYPHLRVICARSFPRCCRKRKPAQLMGEFMNVNGRRISAARGLLYFCMLTCAALQLALGPSGVQAAIPAGSVRIHYYRPDGNYSGWALYTWNASTENASWCQSEVARSE